MRAPVAVATEKDSMGLVSSSAYLDKMTWRFNRKNPYLFRDAMLKLINPENLEYKDLMKAA